MVSWYSKVYNFASSLFFCWLLWGLVFWPRLGDPFVCQSPIGVCVLFSRTAAGLCIYHLFVWSNLNFLHYYILLLLLLLIIYCCLLLFIIIYHIYYIILLLYYYKWLVGWVLWHINLCRLSNAKFIFIQRISSISNNSFLEGINALCHFKWYAV